MIIERDCPWCQDGIITDINTRIDPKVIKHHLKKHAYDKNIGADCDCPRVVTRDQRKCYSCKNGHISTRIRIPIVGDKVKIARDQKPLALALFTIPDDRNMPIEWEEPGTVIDVQEPAGHSLELPNQIAVQVTWDKLRKDGAVPKGKEITVWAFDIMEVVIV